MGIGFPPLYGGAVQYMHGYPGGLAGFVTRASDLATTYGPRFDPPSYLLELVETGQHFPQ
jgi:3-hydroxyacyl-CoA dehydrogenase / enoyl-CoA hydratase / 3-hydroxybutyryl-CoA epimerase